MSDSLNLACLGVLVLMAPHLTERSAVRYAGAVFAVAIVTHAWRSLNV